MSSETPAGDDLHALVKALTGRIEQLESQLTEAFRRLGRDAVENLGRRMLQLELAAEFDDGANRWKHEGEDETPEFDDRPEF